MSEKKKIVILDKDLPSFRALLVLLPKDGDELGKSADRYNMNVWLNDKLERLKLDVQERMVIQDIIYKLLI